MDRLNDAVSWYQKKIGAYDKQLWERSVEQKVLQNWNGYSFQNVPKKTTKIKSQLIDLDLVRGSTFPKTKPQHSWVAVACFGIFRVAFLPIYYQWWVKSTCPLLTRFLLLLYVCMVATLSVYFTDSHNQTSAEDLSLAHLLTPLVMVTIAGLVHAHIVSTQQSARQRTERSRTSLSTSRSKESCGKTPHSKNMMSNGLSQRNQERDSGSHDTGIETNPEDTSTAHIGSSYRKSRAYLRRRTNATKSSKTTKNCDLVGGRRKLLAATDDDDDSDDGLDSARLSTGVKTGESSVLENGSLLKPHKVLEYRVSAEQEDVSANSHENIDPQQPIENLPVCGSLVEHTDELFTTQDKGGNTDDTSSHKTPSTDKQRLDTDVKYTPSADDDAVTMEMTSSTTLTAPPEVVGEVIRSDESTFKRRPPPLNMHPGKLSSSCESDAEMSHDSPISPKLQTSEMEWEEDTMNTDMSSCSEVSTSSDQDANKDASSHPINITNVPQVSSIMNNLASSTDKVSCIIWEGDEVKKAELTVLDVGWSIIQRVDRIPESSDYLILGAACSILLCFMPCAFRLFHSQDKVLALFESRQFPQDFVALIHLLVGDNWRQMVIVINGMVQRLSLASLFFFLLSVVERTFKQRLLYAKHFCYLTSSRRAKKYDLPHFRLNKVRNIKTWLSLRSYLKKRGPQRSVDSIVSAAFILAVSLVSVMCYQLLQDYGSFLVHLGNWDLMLWAMALGLYLLRFMTLGTKINKKYRNFAVLITEQINLYLHMEQKPYKKDELMLANNVLKLAEDLLKELESPSKISGLSANPFLYNITKVIILSAFSAVLSELLGFKLKLYKIKIRA